MNLNSKENPGLLSLVPDDVLIFTIAFLDVCKDSLGYIETLYNDMNLNVNNSDDQEMFDGEDKEVKDMLDEALKQRELSSTKRKDFVMKNKGRRSDSVMKDLDLLMSELDLTKDIDLVHKYMERTNPEAKNWYVNFRRYMKENILGEEDGLLSKTFYRILATTSAQRNPEFNFDLTQSTLDRIPKDFDPEYFEDERGRISSDKIKEEKGLFLHDIKGLMINHKVGIITALKGIEIPGPKVSRFSMNLQGVDAEVTMDVHMFDFLFRNEKDYRIDRGKKVKLQSTSLSEIRRKIGEKIFREKAKNLSLGASQLQAAIWMFRCEVELGSYSSYDYMTNIEDRKNSLSSQISNLKSYLDNR